MSFQRAKSIQTLYDEVSDYDLVLVPDAPLASAINRRLDKPHFGTFATTPRRLAAGRREQAEDRVAFLKLIGETEHSWKNTAYAVGNVLQCWEHQGSAEAVLEYDEYADQVTRDVIEAMSDIETTSVRLSSYSVGDNRSVAVVGLDQFTPLERSILPNDYDTYRLFTEKPFQPGPFHIFESSTAIIDSLLETVTSENAENVAVVLDSGSRFSPLVESALETSGIPFYGGPGFNDDQDHRAYLQILRAAFRGSDMTVRDVRPLLSQLGIDVDIIHDNKRLSTVDNSKIDWIARLASTVSDRTFRHVLQDYERVSGRSLPHLESELEGVGIADEVVTPSRVNDLTFYLQTYEVPVDRENEGVLLADAKSSGYVDRPVVFYLGLDESWTHSAPRRPWVDTEEQFERYISQFQVLLQSGSEQYYLVQDTAGGRPVTPCLYFNELLDEDYERFSDLPSTAYSRIHDGGGERFTRVGTDVDAKQMQLISQSSLNSFVNSPRDYFFSRLLDSPERDYFKEGNLFHDFAEFYVNHPDFVTEKVVDEVVEVLLDETRPFFHESTRPLKRRKYQIGLETIIEFLQTNVPEESDFLTPVSRSGTNFFAEYFGLDLDAPHTERWFSNKSLKVKGKIDLVHNPNRLLDYKSGRKKRRSQIIKQSSLDPPGDAPNFQAILYLTHYRTVRPDEQLEFVFFHFLENLDDIIAGDADLDDTLTIIKYYPYSFDEYTSTQEAYSVLLDGYSDCRETFDDLGYSAYSDIMERLSFPETTEKNELRESEFATKFEAAVDTATADTVNSAKGCDQAIRELNGVRRRAFFEEDLDRFEQFVDERLAELNRYLRGDERFPVDGLGGEPNYRRVDHRDLLLDGEIDE